MPAAPTDLTNFSSLSDQAAKKSLDLLDSKIAANNALTDKLGMDTLGGKIGAGANILGAGMQVWGAIQSNRAFKQAKKAYEAEQWQRNLENERYNKREAERKAYFGDIWSSFSQIGENKDNSNNTSDNNLQSFANQSGAESSGNNTPAESTQQANANTNTNTSGLVDKDKKPTEAIGAGEPMPMDRQ